MEFDIDIPEVEIAFIALHIRGAKISRVEYANSMIRICSSCGISCMPCCRPMMRKKRYLLLEDEELFQGLLTHLSPTITRLQHDLPIYNPLLSQIQREYKELYEQTKQACTVLENIAVLQSVLQKQGLSPCISELPWNAGSIQQHIAVLYRLVSYVPAV